MIENLPKYYKKIASAWSDLDKGFKAVKDPEKFRNLINNFRNGYIVKKASMEQLKRMADALGVKYPDDISKAFLQGRILFTISPNTMTDAILLEICEVFAPHSSGATIDWYPTRGGEKIDYTIEIGLKGGSFLAEEVAELKTMIYRRLQADLDVFIVSTEVLSTYTHEELHTKTHLQMSSFAHGKENYL